MLLGRSVLHVNQDLGKEFRPGYLEGYFNNLTEKVLMQSNLVDSDELPLLETESGEFVEFPVAIFQFGLGAYDLYLETGKTAYYNKFIQCCNWAINKQEASGAWNNFYYIYPDSPYGAMCQGEGCSLLLRAFKETGDEKYYEMAKKAIDFMLIPIEDGGTTEYVDSDVVFMEYTNQDVVLNGWIFAIIGLYDFVLVSGCDRYQELLKKTWDSLMNSLSRFDNGFWSLYSGDKKIASPFYHSLHIAQLQAVYLITQDERAFNMCQIFMDYQKSIIKRIRAFFTKALQKICE